MSSNDIKIEENDSKKDEVVLVSSRNSIKRTEDTSIRNDPNLTDCSSQGQNSQDNSFHNELVYGASIDIPKPKKLGAVNAFLYINGNPLIVIGPDCKL